MIHDLKPGTRTILAGKTGSGKTTVAASLLLTSRQKWIMVDPKSDDKLARLTPSRTVAPMRVKILDAWRKGVQYVRLDRDADADVIDDLLSRLYQEYSNFGVYIDELYYLHSGSRAGPGLQAILTRGRSDLITVLACTQRPSWISLFCLSEADYIGQFRLNLDKDRKTLYSIIGEKAVLKNPVENYSWYFYDQSANKLLLIKPSIKNGDR